MRPGANRRDQVEVIRLALNYDQVASMRPGANRRDQGLFARYRSVDRCATTSSLDRSHAHGKAVSGIEKPRPQP